MKRILLCLSLLPFFSSKAQDFTGFNQSNYAGVTGIYQQPASIVDGRMKFDMNLIGINIGAYNNYVGLKREALKKEGSWSNPNFPAFNDPNFADNYMVEKTNNKNKSVYMGNRIAGPSFMVSLNRKNAIAFSTNIRNYINIDGVSHQLAKLAYEEFKYPTYWVTNLENKNLSIQEMSWAEYGLTYAHVFKDDNEHYFKAGATVKLLQGIQSAYMFVSDLKYNFKTDTTLSIFESGVKYGHSDNLNISNVSIGSNNTGTAAFDYSQSYPGVAFDFGAVYEWRPDYEKYKYDMDGEKGLWRKDQNKYKLKIGFSLTDLGSIKFKKGKTSNDFYANVGYWNLKPISPKTIGEFDDTLKKRFPQTSSSSTYRMNLPTALSVQIDYHVWKDVYVNLTPFVAFQFKKNDTKVHDISSITLTPRWDHKWFGVFIPVQYNFLTGLRTGAAVRLGPLVLGTTNLGPVIGKKPVYGADMYALLKIPIPYGKPKDRDKDGVSNKRDKCKDVPGVWEFMGCPDKDGDHIQDSEDKCPDVAGTKELHGCPDRDGDGITDADDKCPDDKGLAEFNGCPDRDGDKIIDKDDECPDEAGVAEFFGCPDRDGDKTPDKYDACPDVPGPKEYKGCPDKDGDTVLDKDDACPEVAGAVENKGCPWPDTDGDGVIDREDDCPSTPGLKELKGCPPAPVLKAEEQKILEKAFSSLEFATGKDIIKKVSFPSLNELAGLMKQHASDWTLKLSGHTDNQGDAAKNMLLSEKRAKAVKKYLVSKGVKADLIITEWFGQTMPIDSNDTEAGRQRNRRVEMKVMFKK
ncbi:MAG: OmpA family protein [Bacteroidetes bacterium]|nr:OmpA family protein [Bacteroidota bacterium]